MKLEDYFCLNPECEDYGVVAKGNIVFRRHYGPYDTALFQCCVCKKTFSEERPSPLWGLHPIRETRRVFVKPKQRIALVRRSRHRL